MPAGAESKSHGPCTFDALDIRLRKQAFEHKLPSWIVGALPRGIALRFVNFSSGVEHHPATNAIFATHGFGVDSNMEVLFTAWGWGDTQCVLLTTCLGVLAFSGTKT